MSSLYNYVGAMPKSIPQDAFYDKDTIKEGTGGLVDALELFTKFLRAKK